VGKLVVPGFSTFIVPMDSDHLLTVGQYLDEQDFFAPRGVQLSIFDVSDFSTPRQSFNVIIGGAAVSFTDAYSEALTNPKAFTYFASAGLVALPVTIKSYSSPFFDDVFIGPGVDVSDGGVGGSGSGGTAEPGSFAALPAQPVEDENFSGLVVYRVSTEEGFTELGRISAAFDQALFSWTAFTRGVFIEDTVFAATNQGVRGAPIDDVASAPYELFFGDESPIDENGTIADGAESDSSSPGDGVDANAGALPRPLPTPQANP
ncbi:MAG: beta-propeller domain-containing protein, partial [Phycisphaerae bacterium]